MKIDLPYSPEKWKLFVSFFNRHFPSRPKFGYGKPYYATKVNKFRSRYGTESYYR